MSKPMILRITVIFSTLLSVGSLFFALLSGGDIFSIVTRFAMTFAVAAVLIRTTLGIINSVLLRAAVDDHLSKRGPTKTPQKGKRIDFTSAAPKDLLNEQVQVEQREPVSKTAGN
jgi:hypothetical protein